MTFKGHRMTNLDWINLSNVLGLNDAQRYLFLVLPNLADTNGCFEHDPRVICHLTSVKITDLEQLFRIMVNETLLENYEVKGDRYWYLTRFFEMQKLRTKAKLPSPPWLTWHPEKGQVSQGYYQDTRKLSLPSTIDTIDNKFTEIHSRVECEKEKEKEKEKHCNNVTDSACAFQDNDKQRFTQALKDVLDGKDGIRSTLIVDKLGQKHQIIAAMKGRKYNITELWKRFDIEPVGDDWQVYERIVK